MWIKFDTTGYTEEQINQIIDDALCHGFEIKWENGELYYRETIG